MEYHDRQPSTMIQDQAIGFDDTEDSVYSYSFGKRQQKTDRYSAGNTSNGCSSGTEQSGLPTVQRRTGNIRIIYEDDDSNMLMQPCFSDQVNGSDECGNKEGCTENLSVNKEAWQSTGAVCGISQNQHFGSSKENTNPKDTELTVLHARDSSDRNDKKKGCNTTVEIPADAVKFGNSRDRSDSKLEVALPHQLSPKAAECFFSDIMGKYRQKGCKLCVIDGLIEYEGPTTLANMFKMEFTCLKSKVETNIQTDNLGELPFDPKPFDSNEFIDNGVFMEFDSKSKKITFYGEKWEDIQTVKHRMRTKLFPCMVRKKRSFHSVFLSSDAPNVDTSTTDESDQTIINDIKQGVRKTTSTSGNPDSFCHSVDFSSDALNDGTSTRVESDQTITDDTKQGVRKKTPISGDPDSWTESDASNSQYFNVNGVKVKVYNANILSVNVDCVVNATNSQLSLKGGVAKAISKAAGKTLKQERDVFLRKNGKLNVGEACFTTAGKLPYSHVIHTNGPSWSSYKPYTMDNLDRCANDLSMAIKNSLSCAESLGLSTIAIPAVSAGKSGCPKDFSSVQYAKAILDYVVVSKKPLREIHFVDKSDKTIKVIEKTFRHMLRTGFLPEDYDQRRYLKS